MPLPVASRAQGIANTGPDLGASLAEGRLGLVTHLPQTCGSVVPSKIYGILAAGRLPE
jgi:hypothetical protein